MQNIETGYKPEFGLGAWFAGQNAANTEAANEEELIKSFLANQQSLQMNPLLVQKQGYDNDVASYNAAEALAKQNDKAYIPAMLQGAKDQQATIGFDMQRKRDTLQGDVGATNAKNAVSATQDTLLNNFRKAQEVGDTKTANSILEMLTQDPAYQQKLRAQAAQDAAAMARQKAGDDAAYQRALLQADVALGNQNSKGNDPADIKTIEHLMVTDIRSKYPPGPERDYQIRLAAELLKKLQFEQYGLTEGEGGKMDWGKKPPPEYGLKPTKDARGNPVRPTVTQQQPNTTSSGVKYKIIQGQ